MKTLFLILTIFAVALNAQEEVKKHAAKAELTISCEPMEVDTGTSWYQKRVTYKLDGFEPLIIEEDMATGVNPTGAREVHKLGPSRFLLMGGYSPGGGRYTKVAMIITGKDGRLLVQDQLEFSRDRRKFEDRVFKLDESLAVGFPALPAEKDADNHHEVYDWHIVHKGERYYPDTIRSWPLAKIDDLKSEMIAIRVGNEGFLLPTAPKAELGGRGQPAARPESK